jgi:hypothetical protein
VREAATLIEQFFFYDSPVNSAAQGQEEGID